MEGKFQFDRRKTYHGDQKSQEGSRGAWVVLTRLSKQGQCEIEQYKGGDAEIVPLDVHKILQVVWEDQVTTT